MNTSEIIIQLKELECFKAVLPIDKISNFKLVKRPAGIVINLDYSNEPGSHWVALFVNEDNNALYFDSFGFPNFNEYFINFLRTNDIRKIQYNKHQIQSYKSSSCGAFCIIFLKLICNGFSFNEILKLFSTNREQNDLICLKIIEK